MSRTVIEPSRVGTTLLPDRRSLGWAEWGPVSGRPVLFCPGAATSRWLGFAGSELHRLGVRLVSLDRPGLGASTPSPGRQLRDWAADVARFAEARGIVGLAAVGFSQGAPFALACAASGVVTSVAVVSGTDELASAAMRPMLDGGVAQLVDLVASDPHRAEAFFAGMTAQTMWDMVIAGSAPADRDVYTEPVFATAYRRALAEGFLQGPAGYARDTLLAMSPWPFVPGMIGVPVDVWYGELDTSPVHSPDHGATLAARLPSARRHFVRGAGGALPWTHGGVILESLGRSGG